MAVISAYDIRKNIIPNYILLLDLAAWLIVNITYKLPAKSLLVPLLSALLLIFLLLLITHLAGKITHGAALGGGDIKLTGIMGLYLGFWNTLYGVLIAGVIFLVYVLIGKIKTAEKEARKSPHESKKEKSRIYPFGPALCLGALTILMLSLLKVNYP